MRIKQQDLDGAENYLVSSLKLLQDLERKASRARDEATARGAGGGAGGGGAGPGAGAGAGEGEGEGEVPVEVAGSGVSVMAAIYLAPAGVSLEDRLAQISSAVASTLYQLAKLAVVRKPPRLDDAEKLLWQVMSTKGLEGATRSATLQQQGRIAIRRGQ